MKKSIKLKLGLMVFILIILCLIFSNNPLTANTILGISNQRSHFSIFFLISSLSGIFLILGLSLSEDYEEKEVSNNLEKILSSKELDPSQLIAVRAVSNGNTNLKGNKMYAGPFRPTIHFSLNGLVDINKMYGDWSGADTVVLAPFKDLLDQNKQNFYGGSSTDVVLVGYANLPKGTVFLKRENNEPDSHFKSRVNKQIKNMGYKVLPQGDWAWGGSWEATKKFGNLMKKEGYTFGSDGESAFGKAQDEVSRVLLEGASVSSKPLEKMYMVQTAQEKGIPLEDLGITVNNKNGKVKFPDINRFYKFLGKNDVKEYSSYADWSARQVEAGDFIINGEKRNSKLLRDLYLDYLKEAVKEQSLLNERNLKSKKKDFNESKKEIYDWKKRVKSDYKKNGKGSENLPLLTQEGVVFQRGLEGTRLEYEESKERAKRYKTQNESSRYTGYVNVWNNFWTNKTK